MALFGNESKKQAKRLSVGHWMLWSYEIRVASNEAAVVVSQTQLAGEDMHEIGMRLFMSAWEGAARDAVNYYPQHQVEAAYNDQSLRLRALALLTANQVNSSLSPPFTPELIQRLQASLPQPGASDEIARDSSFWSGTDLLDASSLEEVIAEVSAANMEPGLSLEERNAISDGAVAWVDLHEPDKAFNVRDVLVKSEIARHLRTLSEERDDVDDELVATKTLAFLLAYVNDQIDAGADGEMMAAYFDRGIPTIVDAAFSSLLSADAVGFGSPKT